MQRIGRTGRKRTGYVHVLLSEIREEANWDKAKDTYGEVQKSIVRGDQLELYGDVERLLPDHMKPQCLEKKMDIEEYVREEKGKRKKASGTESSKNDHLAAAKKRKRDAEDMGRNIPAGTSTGFVKASELKKRKKRKVMEFDPLAGEDDDTDREIEAGLDGPRRSVSVSAAPSGSTKTKKKTLRKAATIGGSKTTTKEKRKKKSTKTRPVNVSTASQLSHLGLDDSDDLAIEMGIEPVLCQSNSPALSRVRGHPEVHRHWSSSPDPLAMDLDVEFQTANTPAATAQSSSRPKTSSEGRRLKSPKYSANVAIPEDVIDISSSPLPSPPYSPALRSMPSSPIYRSGGSSKSAALAVSPQSHGQSMAWLLDGEDELVLDIDDLSPILDRKKLSSAHPTPNYDDTIEIVDHYIPPSPVDYDTRQPRFRRNDSAKIVEDDSVEVLPSKPLISSPLIPLHLNSDSPQPKMLHNNIDMLPPDLPSRLTMPSPGSVFDPECPEPSFAVRPPGKRPKKRIAMPSEPESPLQDVPSLSQRRLQRKRSSSSSSPSPTLVLQPKKKKKSRVLRKHNPWVDIEAVHSGDDVSEGSSQADDMETEFDRKFLQGRPETQVSPSYDQTLAYRQSLFTQAPMRGKAPVFANRPAVRGAFYGAGLPSRGRPLVSSSPPIHDDEPNEYAMGSFVVDDDAEITYASSEL